MVSNADSARWALKGPHNLISVQLKVDYHPQLHTYQINLVGVTGFEPATSAVRFGARSRVPHRSKDTSWGGLVGTDTDRPERTLSPLDRLLGRVAQRQHQTRSILRCAHVTHIITDGDPNLHRHHAWL